MECIVEYDYEAAEEDELTLTKGDIITSASMYEDGWMKGILRGKEGVFPDNFVKIIKPESKTPEKTETKSGNFRKSQEDLIMSTKKSQNAETPLAAGSKARVVHKYSANQKDELSLELGAIVEILEMSGEEEEDGWLRGSCNGRIGVFPANFVAPLSPSSTRRWQNAPQESGDNSQPSGPPKKVVGVGFGNIFAGEKIQLKTTSVKDVKRESEDGNQAPAPRLVPRPNKGGQSASSERVIVKFPYKGENVDELTIDKGDIITIINKNLEDDGWWKGELNGKIGVFPDNFVEPYPIGGGGSIHRDDKAKPSRPAPPLPLDKPTNASEKSGLGKKAAPPIIAKKPGGSKAPTNGRVPGDKGDGLFDNLPDHQPLQTLTSDRPRVANKRLPSKEFLRASGGKDGVNKNSTLPIRPTVGVQEEATADKEDEKQSLKREPPPRPISKPINPPSRPEPSTHSLNSSTPSIHSKPTTTPLPSGGRPVAAPPILPPTTEPGVTAADLTELRRIFDNRLSEEISELRAEMERMRSALTGRIHSLTAEIDEEKRMRHSAQVELERVRRLLQERELNPGPVTGDHLSHQSHSTA